MLDENIIQGTRYKVREGSQSCALSEVDFESESSHLSTIFNMLAARVLSTRHALGQHIFYRYRLHRLLHRRTRANGKSTISASHDIYDHRVAPQALMISK